MSNFAVNSSDSHEKSVAGIVCTECNEVLPSRNALYKHLETHGIERESVHAEKPNKVILLVGWLSDEIHEDAWTIDGHLAHSWSVTADSIENELWKAIDAIDGAGAGARDSVRGLSRASGCAQRATHLLQMEPSCHCVSDVICFQLKKKSRPKDITWLHAVNDKLPPHIRIIEVYNPPSVCCEFHAETVCSQRRFEYVLPLDVLFQPHAEVNDASPFVPLLKKQTQNLGDMDNYFPRDTREGVYRIENFRRLKLILKLFNGRHAMHNFVTGGACPEDGHIKQRVDRFFHKELLAVTSSTCSVASRGGEVDGKDIAVHRDAVHASTDSQRDDTAPSPVSEWAVFSLSGNNFLKGQARKMIGLAIGVFRGWLSMEFLEAALNTDRILNIPSAPACGLYLAECKFDKWEAKYGFVIDPRRAADGEASRLNEWLRLVQHRAVAQMSQQGNWLEQLQEQCVTSMALFEAENQLLNRDHAELQRLLPCRLGIPDQLGSAVRDAYASALHFLREAERSGQWPTSSLARQKVIEASSLAENGSIGGTFSVGFLPPPLTQPKANDLFPDLLVACFRLEKVLFPDRPPSSTIAINRHAQFKPHRDTGAGSGQTTSLIVALGDFSGGELMVENDAKDIRYNAVEFDGWGQRHWGLPFEGERFSLVWFTPLGVRIPEDLWWLDRL